MDGRPEVRTKFTRETTVTFEIDNDTHCSILTAYLKKTYPEFRRTNLVIEYTFNTTDGVVTAKGWSEERGSK